MELVETKQTQGRHSRDELLLQLDMLEQIATRYELCDHVERITDRKHDAILPLVVLIAGEGNFGKSSLINHIAGREIAPVSILPLTWKVDVYLESDTGEDYAILREAGQVNGRKVSIAEARELCAHEEQSLKEGKKSRPSIVEVVWCMVGLSIGKDLCLVDTPGLSAAGLGVDLVVERLVKGLGGSKFILEDVWARYYHRADVVIWAFEATKIESAATFETLKKLCLLQQKEIIPVVTKADRVPKDRWKEVKERIIELYHAQFGKAFRHDDIYITICGGKSADVGFGIQQLRTVLQRKYAPIATEKKGEATRLFIVDLSREINHIIEVCAKQLIANLRIIADTADEVALVMMRQRLDAEKELRRHNQQFISRLHQELFTNIKPLFISLLNGNETEHGFHEQVLSRGIDIQSIENDMRNRLRMLGTTIHSRAVVLSTTRRLKRARIGSSGNETDEVFSFELTVNEPDVSPIKMGLHSISIPSASSLKEWAKETWVKIKRFFGSDDLSDNETKALSKYCNEVIQRFSNKLNDETSVFIKYQKGGLAPALRTAVENSLEKVHSCNVQSLISALEEVDDDIKLLNGMQHGEGIASRYADWARYWISESRDVALVRRLAANIIGPNIGKLRQHIIEFPLPGLPDNTKRCIWALWRRGAYRVVDNMAITDDHLQSNDSSTRDRLSQYYQAEVRVSALLLDYDQKRYKDRQHTVHYLLDCFNKWVGKDAILTRFEQELGESLPGASARQTIQSYASILSNVYLSGINSLLIGTNIKNSIQVSGMQALTVSSVWKKLLTLLLLVSILFILIGILAKYTPSVFHYLTTIDRLHRFVDYLLHNNRVFIVATPLAFLSFVCLMLSRSIDIRLSNAMNSACEQHYHDVMTAVNALTARKVDTELIDDLTSQMIIQLNPRPLQRALAGGEE